MYTVVVMENIIGGHVRSSGDHQKYTFTLVSCYIYKGIL